MNCQLGSPMSHARPLPLIVLAVLSAVAPAVAQENAVRIPVNGASASDAFRIPADAVDPTAWLVPLVPLRDLAARPPLNPGHGPADRLKDAARLHKAVAAAEAGQQERIRSAADKLVRKKFGTSENREAPPEWFALLQRLRRERSAEDPLLPEPDVLDELGRLAVRAALDARPPDGAETNLAVLRAVREGDGDAVRAALPPPAPPELMLPGRFDLVGELVWRHLRATAGDGVKNGEGARTEETAGLLPAVYIEDPPGPDARTVRAAVLEDLKQEIESARAKAAVGFWDCVSEEIRTQPPLTRSALAAAYARRLPPERGAAAPDQAAPDQDVVRTVEIVREEYERRAGAWEGVLGVLDKSGPVPDSWAGLFSELGGGGTVAAGAITAEDLVALRGRVDRGWAHVGRRALTGRLRGEPRRLLDPLGPGRGGEAQREVNAIAARAGVLAGLLPGGTAARLGGLDAATASQLAALRTAADRFATGAPIPLPGGSAWLTPAPAADAALEVKVEANGRLSGHLELSGELMFENPADGPPAAATLPVRAVFRFDEADYASTGAAFAFDPAGLTVRSAVGGSKVAALAGPAAAAGTIGWCLRQSELGPPDRLAGAGGLEFVIRRPPLSGATDRGDVVSVRLSLDADLPGRVREAVREAGEAWADILEDRLRDLLTSYQKQLKELRPAPPEGGVSVWNVLDAAGASGPVLFEEDGERLRARLGPLRVILDPALSDPLRFQTPALAWPSDQDAVPAAPAPLIETSPDGRAARISTALGGLSFRLGPGPSLEVRILDGSVLIEDAGTVADAIQVREEALRELLASVPGSKVQAVREAGDWTGGAVADLVLPPLPRPVTIPLSDDSAAWGRGELARRVAGALPRTVSLPTPVGTLTLKDPRPAVGPGGAPVAGVAADFSLVVAGGGGPAATCSGQCVWDLSTGTLVSDGADLHAGGLTDWWSGVAGTDPADVRAERLTLRFLPDPRVELGLSVAGAGVTAVFDGGPIRLSGDVPAAAGAFADELTKRLAKRLTALQRSCRTPAEVAGLLDGFEVAAAGVSLRVVDAAVADAMPGSGKTNGDRLVTGTATVRFTLELRAAGVRALSPPLSVPVKTIVKARDRLPILGTARVQLAPIRIIGEPRFGVTGGPVRSFDEVRLSDLAGLLPAEVQGQAVGLLTLSGPAAAMGDLVTLQREPVGDAATVDELTLRELAKPDDGTLRRLFGLPADGPAIWQVLLDGEPLKIIRTPRELVRVTVDPTARPAVRLLPDAAKVAEALQDGVERRLLDVLTTGDLLAGPFRLYDLKADAANDAVRLSGRFDLKTGGLTAGGTFARVRLRAPTGPHAAGEPGADWLDFTEADFEFDAGGSAASVNSWLKTVSPTVAALWEVQSVRVRVVASGTAGGSPQVRAALECRGVVRVPLDGGEVPVTLALTADEEGIHVRGSGSEGLEKVLLAATIRRLHGRQFRLGPARVRLEVAPPPQPAGGAGDGKSDLSQLIFHFDFAGKAWTITGTFDDNRITLSADTNACVDLKNAADRLFVANLEELLDVEPRPPLSIEVTSAKVCLNEPATVTLGEPLNATALDPLFGLKAQAEATLTLGDETWETTAEITSFSAPTKIDVSDLRRKALRFLSDELNDREGETALKARVVAQIESIVKAFKPFGLPDPWKVELVDLEPDNVKVQNGTVVVSPFGIKLLKRKELVVNVQGIGFDGRKLSFGQASIPDEQVAALLHKLLDGSPLPLRTANEQIRNGVLTFDAVAPLLPGLTLRAKGVEIPLEAATQEPWAVAAGALVAELKSTDSFEIGPGSVRLDGARINFIDKQLDANFTLDVATLPVKGTLVIEDGAAAVDLETGGLADLLAGQVGSGLGEAAGAVLESVGGGGIEITNVRTLWEGEPEKSWPRGLTFDAHVPVPLPGVSGGRVVADLSAVRWDRHGLHLDGGTVRAEGQLELLGLATVEEFAAELTPDSIAGSVRLAVAGTVELDGAFSFTGGGAFSLEADVKLEGQDFGRGRVTIDQPNQTFGFGLRTEMSGFGLDVDATLRRSGGVTEISGAGRLAVFDKGGLAVDFAFKPAVKMYAADFTLNFGGMEYGGGLTIVGGELAGAKLEGPVPFFGAITASVEVDPGKIEIQAKLDPVHVTLLLPTNFSEINYGRLWAEIEKLLKPELGGGSWKKWLSGDFLKRIEITLSLLPENQPDEGGETPEPPGPPEAAETGEAAPGGPPPPSPKEPVRVADDRPGSAEGLPADRRRGWRVVERVARDGGRVWLLEYASRVRPADGDGADGEDLIRTHLDLSPELVGGVFPQTPSEQRERPVDVASLGGRVHLWALGGAEPSRPWTGRAVVRPGGDDTRFYVWHDGVTGRRHAAELLGNVWADEFEYMSVATDSAGTEPRSAETEPRDGPRWARLEPVFTRVREAGAGFVELRNIEERTFAVFHNGQPDAEIFLLDGIERAATNPPTPSELRRTGLTIPLEFCRAGGRSGRVSTEPLLKAVAELLDKTVAPRPLSVRGAHPANCLRVGKADPAWLHVGMIGDGGGGFSHLRVTRARLSAGAGAEGSELLDRLELAPSVQTAAVLFQAAAIADTEVLSGDEAPADDAGIIRYRPWSVAVWVPEPAVTDAVGPAAVFAANAKSSDLETDAAPAADAPAHLAWLDGDGAPPAWLERKTPQWAIYAFKRRGKSRRGDPAGRPILHSAADRFDSVRFGPVSAEDGADDGADARTLLRRLAAANRPLRGAALFAPAAGDYAPATVWVRLGPAGGSVGSVPAPTDGGTPAELTDLTEGLWLTVDAGADDTRADGVAHLWAARPGFDADLFRLIRWAADTDHVEAAAEVWNQLGDFASDLSGGDIRVAWPTPPGPTPELPAWAVLFDGTGSAAGGRRWSAAMGAGGIFSQWTQTEGPPPKDADKSFREFDAAKNGGTKSLYELLEAAE